MVIKYEKNMRKKNMTLVSKFWNKIFGSDEIELSSEESEILSLNNDLLKFDDTTIDIDILANKYYVDNIKLHLTVCIIGNSNVIQFINTNDNIDKKFREDFVLGLIDVIIDAKHARMEDKFRRLQDRSQIMFNRIGDAIRVEKHNRQESLSMIPLAVK